MNTRLLPGGEETGKPRFFQLWYVDGLMPKNAEISFMPLSSFGCFDLGGDCAAARFINRSMSSLKAPLRAALTASRMPSRFAMMISPFIRILQ